LIKIVEEMSRENDDPYQTGLPKFPESVSEMFRNLGHNSFSSEIQGQTKEEILGEFYQGYLIESFEKMIEYVNSDIYLKSNYQVKINKNPENENILIFDVKVDEEYLKYEKSLENARKGEKILRELQKYYRTPVFGRMPYKQDSRFPSQLEKSSINLLSRTYGEIFNKNFDLKILPERFTGIHKTSKFHKHKWNILVYIPLEKYRGNNLELYKSTDLICLTDKELKTIAREIRFYD